MSCLLLGLVVAQACASRHAAFEPTEHVEGRTVEGFKEAIYDLAVAGEIYGEVKVWSSGADLVETGDGAITQIRVGFTIENGGDLTVSLAVDEVRLESVQTTADESQRVDLRAASINGDTEVPPGTSGEATAIFYLSGELAPTDIRAFRVRWTTLTDGQEFTEFTPFVQRRTEYAYVPVYAYYYPYYPWDYPYYDPWYSVGHRNVVIVDPYPRRVVVRGHRRR